MELFGYRVSISSVCTEDYREECEDGYGNWSSSHSNYFESIEKSDSKLPDVLSESDFKTGDKCFVVWVEWSSGNSFGRGFNSDCECLWVFKTEKSAVEFCDYVKEITEDDDSLSKYQFESEDGEMAVINGLPWCGYFEKLEELHIEDTVII